MFDAGATMTNARLAMNVLHPSQPSAHEAEALFQHPLEDGSALTTMRTRRVVKSQASANECENAAVTRS